VKTKGNKECYFLCPHFDFSCWEDLGDGDEELSYFLTNSAERKGYKNWKPDALHAYSHIVRHTYTQIKQW